MWSNFKWKRWAGKGNRKFENGYDYKDQIDQITEAKYS